MKKIILLIFLIVSVSCETDDNDGTNSKLPEITTEGKNTFGATINGEVFLPKRKTCLFCTNVLTANYFHVPNTIGSFNPGYYLNLRAINELTNKQISITMTAFETPLVMGQTYPITLKEENSISGFYKYTTKTPDPNNPNISYFKAYPHITNEDFQGTMEIIFIDENQQIVSGIFYFDCINEETGDLVEIRSGRFDVIYELYPN